MAYSRKFEGLFGTLGYTRTVDCTSQSSDTIRAAIEQGYADRALLRTEAEAALAQGLDKLGLYQRALRDLLASVK